MKQAEVLGDKDIHRWLPLRRGPISRRLPVSADLEAVHEADVVAEVAGVVKELLIEEGGYADLVLFNPESVRDRSTPDAPHRVSEGIEKVWVNGVLVFEDGAVTDARPGRVVRRPD